MKPLFTVHVGEYLVGEYLERKYPNWHVWIPAKDTGVDLLVTDAGNRKTVTVQVKFSKDFNPTHHSQWPVIQSRCLASGWWTLDSHKIEKSNADLWIFVLPAFAEKQTSFIIVPPAELLRKFQSVFAADKRRIHSYLWVTKSGRCWETRDLAKADLDIIAAEQFSDTHRDFTRFLNAWEQIESKLA